MAAVDPCLDNKDVPLSVVLSRASAGDRGALGDFYDATSALVYSLAERLLGDPFRAEETVLEVFRYVWERGASYDPERGSVRSWLMSITRSRTLDRRRADAARGSREQTVEEGGDAISSNDEGPQESAENQERADRLEASLRHLPDNQRRAIEMAFFQGRTHDEIAQRLATPIGTIKSQIRRGLLRLHDLLKTQESER